MKKLLLTLALLASPFTWAQPAMVVEELELSAEQNLLNLMQATFPNRQVVAVDQIKPGVLYQVSFASGLNLFALADGQYFVAGNLFEITESGVVDVSKHLKQQSRAELLASLQTTDYLTLLPAELEPEIEPGVEPGLETESEPEVKLSETVLESSEAPGQPQAPVIYVFVDIDCYYCQFQHQESAKLTAAGVEVRYLSYNRQKPGSSAYHKVRRTWCSNEPQAALDMMMQGSSLAEHSCTPGLMDKHIALAKAMGVQRLPAVVTVDGRLTEGLLRAEQIFNLLGIEPPADPVEEPVAETPVLEIAP